MLRRLLLNAGVSEEDTNTLIMADITIMEEACALMLSFSNPEDDHLESLKDLKVALVRRIIHIIYSIDESVVRRRGTPSWYAARLTRTTSMACFRSRRRTVTVTIYMDSRTASYNVLRFGTMET